RVHVHVAEADVLDAGVDLQRHSLLLGRADHDAVAHGDDRLPPGIATVGTVLLCQAGAWVDVFSLVSESAGACTDREAAKLAEIVATGMFAGWLILRGVARAAA